MVFLMRASESRFRGVLVVLLYLTYGAFCTQGCLSLFWGIGTGSVSKGARVFLVVCPFCPRSSPRYASKRIKTWCLLFTVQYLCRLWYAGIQSCTTQASRLAYTRDPWADARSMSTSCRLSSRTAVSFLLSWYTLHPLCMHNGSFSRYLLPLESVLDNFFGTVGILVSRNNLNRVCCSVLLASLEYWTGSSWM